MVGESEERGQRCCALRRGTQPEGALGGAGCRLPRRLRLQKLSRIVRNSRRVKMSAGFSRSLRFVFDEECAANIFQLTLFLQYLDSISTGDDGFGGVFQK